MSSARGLCCFAAFVFYVLLLISSEAYAGYIGGKLFNGVDLNDVMDDDADCEKSQDSLLLDEDINRQRSKHGLPPAKVSGLCHDICSIKDSVSVGKWVLLPTSVVVRQQHIDQWTAMCNKHLVDDKVLPSGIPIMIEWIDRHTVLIVGSEDSVGSCIQELPPALRTLRARSSHRLAPAMKIQLSRYATSADQLRTSDSETTENSHHYLFALTPVQGLQEHAAQCTSCLVKHIFETMVEKGHDHQYTPSLSKNGQSIYVSVNARVHDVHHIRNIIHIASSIPLFTRIELLPDFAEFSSSLSINSAISHNPLEDTFHDIGLRGEGQVVGVGDSGVDWDSCYFLDAEQTKPPFDPDFYKGFKSTHRKFTAYYTSGDNQDEWYKDSRFGHGSHVAGIIAGNAKMLSGHQCEIFGSERPPYAQVEGISYDGAQTQIPWCNDRMSHQEQSLFDDSWGPGQLRGVASEARLAFVDMHRSKDLPSSNWRYTFSRLNEKYLPDMYLAGAHVMSNSWNIAMPQSYYTAYESAIDQYLHDHPDTIVIFSSGNSGHRGRKSIYVPAGAKSVLSVGATRPPLAHAQRFGSEPADIRVQAIRRSTGSSSRIESSKSNSISHEWLWSGIVARFSLLGHINVTSQLEFVNGSLCHERMSAEPLTMHDYDSFGGFQAWKARCSRGQGKVFAIPRGNCFFLTKVRNAVREHGVCAVIIMNPSSQNDMTEALPPVNQTIADVKIPVVVANGVDINFINSFQANGNVSWDTHVSIQDRPNNDKENWDASVASYSARGPTYDERVKPDLVAPGEVSSVHSDGDPWSFNCFKNGRADSVNLVGTSMAAPIVSGAAALYRQYFMCGCHGIPLWADLEVFGVGQANGCPSWCSGHKFYPSGMLIKAMLILNTVDLRGNLEQFKDGDLSQMQYLETQAAPSNSQGFGALKATKHAAIPNNYDPNYWQMYICDDKQLEHQELWNRSLTVAEDGTLAVSLAWYDKPGASGSGYALINDLDLIVTVASRINETDWLDRRIVFGNSERHCPSAGVRHDHGTSSFSNAQHRETSEGGSSSCGPDRLNTVEKVEIKVFQGERVTLQVFGFFVHSQAQKFSLVAYSKFSKWTGAPPISNDDENGGSDVEPSGGEEWIIVAIVVAVSCILLIFCVLAAVIGARSSPRIASCMDKLVYSPLRFCICWRSGRNNRWFVLSNSDGTSRDTHTELVDAANNSSDSQHV